MDRVRQLERILAQESLVTLDDENLSLKRRLRSVDRRILLWEKTFILAEIAFLSNIPLGNIGQMVVTKSSVSMKGADDA